jgi:fused signal recognition particle receptor
VNLWNKIRSGLTRTRERIESSVGQILNRRSVNPADRDKLEEALLLADVGPAMTDRLIEDASKRLRSNQAEDLRAALEAAATSVLSEKSARFEPGPERPWVALLVGVNGVGKTTLAGKLARRFQRDGHPTLLVAADTFRAAAAEQLEVWAGRAGVEVVRSRDGSDPAAVVHDGLSAARSRGMHAVLVDTAGRLHSKGNLMAELEKMSRVCGRVIPGAPHHVLLVLDATLGLNALQQAREFSKAVPVTSLALTKLDGTARGGSVIAIVNELGLPVSVAGIGEGEDDWEVFDPEGFARGIFG